MSNAETPTGRGWYPDPFSKGELLRLFDGARWTAKTRPIPDDYDAKHASDGAETSKSAEQPTNQPNPPEPKPEPEPKPTKEEPKPKTKPARNGTAPMFTTPAVKASGKEEKQDKANNPKAEPKPATKQPAQKPAPKPAAAQPAARPAFASPTVKALRPDEAPGQKKATPPAPEPQQPQKPALDPAQAPPKHEPAPQDAQPKAAAKLLFAKPATPQVAEQKTPAPTVTKPATPSFSKPAPSGVQGSSPMESTPETVDAKFEEDSDTVTAAFAEIPNTAEYDDAVEYEEQTSGSTRFAGLELPQLDGVKAFVTKYRVGSWLVAGALALGVIAGPQLVPSPVNSVARECQPISNVVASYDGADDFSVTEKAQADIASAVSTGKLNAETAQLASTAVETNNMQPIVEACLPQEE